MTSSLQNVVGVEKVSKCDKQEPFSEVNEKTFMQECTLQPIVARKLQLKEGLFQILYLDLEIEVNKKSIGNASFEFWHLIYNAVFPRAENVDKLQISNFVPTYI